MKPRGRGRPDTPTIWLIPEDRTGFFVFQAIVEKRKLNAHVVLRGKAESFDKLAIEIEDVLISVLEEMQPGDCIIILHDTDDSVQTDRKWYKHIDKVCQKKKFRQHVSLITATEEIEAWLLADKGLCRWLKVSPSASDHISQPSKRLAKLINDKHKMKWNDLNKPKILQHMDVTGEILSESMRTAMQTFLAMPCNAKLSRGASAPGAITD